MNSLLCSCVGGFICGVCFVTVRSTSLFLLVPREGYLRDCDYGITWVS